MLESKKIEKKYLHIWVYTLLNTLMLSTRASLSKLICTLKIKWLISLWKNWICKSPDTEISRVKNSNDLSFELMTFFEKNNLLFESNRVRIEALGRNTKYREDSEYGERGESRRKSTWENREDRVTASLKFAMRKNIKNNFMEMQLRGASGVF